jgi:soluble lytic murein transglycosylase
VKSRSTRTLVAWSLAAALPAAGGRPAAQTSLAPTAHASLPSNASDLWLVPTGTDAVARGATQYRSLADASLRYAEGEYEAALRAASAPTLRNTTLAGYATYLVGLSQLRLSRTDEARRTLDALLASKPAGFLAIAVTLAAGEAAEAAADHSSAARLYAALAANKLAVTDDVLDRLGRASLAAGDKRQAAEAYVRLYYEFPLSSATANAATQMEALKDYITRQGYDGDVGRAQMLFGARRYSESKDAFEAIRPSLDGDQRELADLRIAESNFYLRRYAAARDGVRPYLQKASRLAEARYFYLSAIRELGYEDEYIALTRALVAEFPDSTWAEDALNSLGTHYIVTNEDEAAAEVFREQYAKFPDGQHSERAAWKYGWWSYKTGNHAEAIRVFESAASAFPRSNYRPSYIYWAGRAHGKAGAPGERTARMRLVYADYGNSYYGRLAETHLRRAGALPARDAIRHATNAQPAEPPPTLPTNQTIRQLLAAGLYDAAIDELRYAQRAWGNSPAIEATMAWAYHQKGELRRAITLMRRAYPQHMTANGQELPDEILKVIFPLEYWSSIRRESAARGLDPYVIAALIAQESTFDPEIRSVANAWGLMQIVPTTGRRLARNLGVRGFSTARLKDPQLNIRLGTYYFSKLVEQFGGTFYALASYNAGESRVVRWKAERPRLDEDEFIDDIPFPETQNYVKRILGTAEDYRTLYGDVSAPASSNASRKPSTKTPARKK